MVHACNAAACALLQPDLRAFDLTVGGTTLQLPCDLDHLRDACCPKRMPLG